MYETYIYTKTTTHTLKDNSSEKEMITYFKIQQ